MGLALTYSTLVSMLQEWAESEDEEFTAQIDNIIKQAEDLLLRDLNLPIFDVTTTGTIAIGDTYITKPTDMVVVRNLSFLSGTTRILLQPRTTDYIETCFPDTTLTGTPKCFAEHSTTQWMIGPSSSGTYTWRARYVKRPTSLSSTNTTTWLATHCGDVLFIACMIFAETYQKEDATEQGRINTFKQDYARLIQSTRDEIKMNNYQLGEMPQPPVEG